MSGSNLRLKLGCKPKHIPVHPDRIDDEDANRNDAYPEGDHCFDAAAVDPQKACEG